MAVDQKRSIPPSTKATRKKEHQQLIQKLKEKHETHEAHLRRRRERHQQRMQEDPEYGERKQEQRRQYMQRLYADPERYFTMMARKLTAAKLMRMGIGRTAEEHASWRLRQQEWSRISSRRRGELMKRYWELLEEGLIEAVTDPGLSKSQRRQQRINRVMKRDRQGDIGIQGLQLMDVLNKGVVGKIRAGH